MGIYFTSDLHFSHGFVADTRGFDSTREHDAWIVREWNKVVTDDDTVYVLGDFGMGHPDRWIDNASLLRGQKHLIPGNHDNANLDFKPYNADRMAYYESTFLTIQQHGKIKYKGTTFLMSHYPYEADHTEDVRHDQWRLKDLGAPLLHGHVHSHYKFSLSANGTSQVHVGWDTWGKPVALGELHALYKEFSLYGR